MFDSFTFSFRLSLVFLRMVVEDLPMHSASVECTLLNTGFYQTVYIVTVITIHLLECFFRLSILFSLSSASLSNDSVSIHELFTAVSNSSIGQGIGLAVLMAVMWFRQL